MSDFSVIGSSLSRNLVPRAFPAGNEVGCPGLVKIWPDSKWRPVVALNKNIKVGRRLEDRQGPRSVTKSLR